MVVSNFLYRSWRFASADDGDHRAAGVLAARLFKQIGAR
jgi:hypothetical protein